MLNNVSAFKKLPKRNRVQTWRTVLFVTIGISALSLGYLEKYYPDYLMFEIFLGAVLFVLGFFLLWQQHIGRCPECGESLREIFSDSHPKAKEFHLLYCDGCDIIWDTTIPKSSG